MLDWWKNIIIIWPISSERGPFHLHDVATMLGVRSLVKTSVIKVNQLSQFIQNPSAQVCGHVCENVSHIEYVLFHTIRKMFHIKYIWTFCML